jgi:hypothetical protein
MATKTNGRKQNKIFETILTELQIIKTQLEKFILLIPEENLKNYKNYRQIKKNFLKALKTFPPK